ncbi:hypothetical protein BLK93_21150 [Klebsiella pneumoniae]|nr:hypothetical protein BLK93_21150 [Klebsiella pneumoniae]
MSALVDVFTPPRREFCNSLNFGRGKISCLLHGCKNQNCAREADSKLFHSFYIFNFKCISNSFFLFGILAPKAFCLSKYEFCVVIQLIENFASVPEY